MCMFWDGDGTYIFFLFNLNPNQEVILPRQGIHLPWQMLNTKRYNLEAVGHRAESSLTGRKWTCYSGGPEAFYQVNVQVIFP